MRDLMKRGRESEEGHVLALVLAGGYGSAETGILRSMTSVRKAIALDLLERLRMVRGLCVVLLSDDEEMLQEALRMGCRARQTAKPFVWLREVQEAVRAEAGS